MFRQTFFEIKCCVISKKHLYLSSMDRKSRSILLLILAMFAWGSLYPVSKYIMTEASPLTISFLRYLFGIAAITPLFIIDFVKNRNQLSANDYLSFSAAGVLGVSLFALLLFFGIKLSTASNGSIIANTQPIFTAVLAPIIIKEAITKSQITGIAAGLAGMILVITGGHLSGGGNSAMLLGNLLLCGAALSMSVYSIILKKPIRRIGSLIPTYISMLAGTILLFIVNIFSGSFFSDLRMLTKPSDILLILYLGCAATALPYLLFNNALKHIDVIKATGFKFLIPVSGVSLSIIFLSERPEFAVYAGIIIVILSVFLIQRSPKRDSD